LEFDQGTGRWGWQKYIIGRRLNKESPGPGSRNYKNKGDFGLESCLKVQRDRHQPVCKWIQGLLVKSIFLFIQLTSKFCNVSRRKWDDLLSFTIEWLSSEKFLLHFFIKSLHKKLCQSAQNTCQVGVLLFSKPFGNVSNESDTSQYLIRSFNPHGGLLVYQKFQSW